MQIFNEGGTPVRGSAGFEYRGRVISMSSALNGGWSVVVLDGSTFLSEHVTVQAAIDAVNAELAARQLTSEEIHQQAPASFSWDEAGAWGMGWNAAMATKLGYMRPLTGPGQVQAGDVVGIRIGGDEYAALVSRVLNPGTDREEVIYDKPKNYYFITSMVVAGTSSHKDVHFMKKKAAKS